MNIGNGIILFDKSFFQSINPEEAKKLDRYNTFILELEIFFQIALAAELEGVKLEGNSLYDVEYLHYLPFCKFFIAKENFHKNYASLFMSEGQKFISAEDMKQHLSEI